MVNLIKFIKENKLLLAIFLISTLFFIIQRTTYLHWDFASYSLNAKYLFYKGTYFETLRPPLASILLGLFGIFEPLTEYIYILFVSLLFLISIINLSDTVFYKEFFNKKIKKENLRFVFYFFSMSYFVLLFGLREGTEMLALGFFTLFLSFLIQNKISGHFLALAFLSRYSFLVYSPFLLANKNYKKIIKNILLFLIIIFPWLLFNYLKFGNWFTSIIDAYANNILFRQELMLPFNYSHLFFVIGIFLPFFIIGIFYSIKEIIKSKDKFSKENIIIYLFLAILIISLKDYAGIPLKQARYLFNLSLPVAFFSTIGLFYLIKNKGILKKINVIILIIFIVTSIFSFALIIKISPQDNKFRYVQEDIKSLGLENCEILSPHWVLVTYYTENVYPLGENDINDALKEGKVILIFQNNPTLDDDYTQKNLENNILLKKDNYIFLYEENRTIENCSKKYVFDFTYVNNHCEIIASKFEKVKLDKLTLNICKWINKN